MVSCAPFIFSKTNSKFIQVMDPDHAAAIADQTTAVQTIADQTIAAAMAAKEDLSKKLLPVNSPQPTNPSSPPPPLAALYAIRIPLRQRSVVS